MLMTAIHVDHGYGGRLK